MIAIRSASERGFADHGWLKAYHSFSFGSYVDRNHMGFRSLRVMNEDRIKAGHGFGTHPHKNMEIITYVISGELEHKDSMGNGSSIRAGEFQAITAGTGITHSELNPSAGTETHLYQIWILPEREGLSPNYQEGVFASEEQRSHLKLVASRDGGDDTLQIHQDVRLFHGRLEEGIPIELPLSSSRYAWLQLIKGELEINDYSLLAGDGASFSEENRACASSKSSAEFLFFDLS